MAAERVLFSSDKNVSECCVSKACDVAMVSVEDVNFELEEFFRNQQLANERFEPKGEQQDIFNSKFDTKIAELEEDAVKTETRMARLE